VPDGGPLLNMIKYVMNFNKADERAIEEQGRASASGHDEVDF
jgi:hypothetical protein